MMADLTPEQLEEAQEIAEKWATKPAVRSGTGSAYFDQRTLAHAVLALLSKQSEREKVWKDAHVSAVEKYVNAQEREKAMASEIRDLVRRMPIQLDEQARQRLEALLALPEQSEEEALNGVMDEMVADGLMVETTPKDAKEECNHWWVDSGNGLVCRDCGLPEQSEEEARPWIEQDGKRIDPASMRVPEEEA
jgi:hypothetical protein